MTTVLVVDDSPVDRTLVQGLLKEGSGVQVDFASDGAEALISIGQSTPDIVVTDLHMPTMNGMQLVESIHTEYPQVPVVLITGKGSEELAVTALKSGAASYVPKATLARDLLPSVMHVLAVSRANKCQQRMHSCALEHHCRFELDNDYQMISPLIGMIQRIVEGMQLFDSTQRVQFSMAVEQAVSNALYHGNLELTTEDLENVGYDLFDDEESTIVQQRKSQPPYRDRKIHVESHITRGEARVSVRDEGPGFDVRTIPSPDELVTSDRLTGRGITYMRLFSDELIFNQQGNEVTLIKHAGTNKQS
jgi:CheY-like chemotaxis protein